jgi:hypothetical protein
MRVGKFHLKCLVGVLAAAGIIGCERAVVEGGPPVAKQAVKPAASSPATAAAAGNAGAAATQKGVTEIAVTFSGGHETDGQDKGRPVVLIAAALNVPAETFRKAFSAVRPAPGGREPEPAQVRANKKALMDVLEPLGVTDERLNDVSNCYRYRPGAGELWKHTPAKAVAMLQDGKVTGFRITDAGSGYSSAPTVSVPGYPAVQATASVSFGTDLKTNGSIKEITLAK